MLHSPCNQIIRWRTKSSIWLEKQGLRRGFRATGDECHSADNCKREPCGTWMCKGGYTPYMCSGASLPCLKPLSVCCWIIFWPQVFPIMVSEQYAQWRSSHRSCLQTLQGSAVHHPCKVSKLPPGQKLLALKVFSCPCDTWNSMWRNLWFCPAGIML